jgi:hypothetical protein
MGMFRSLSEFFELTFLDAVPNLVAIDSEQRAALV